MFEPDLTIENALQFSRFDENHPLSAVSAHPFELSEQKWATAEHYYQACKFSPEEAMSAFSKKIAACATATEANKLGNGWWKRKRSGFKQARTTLMTRALYSKVQQHPEVKDYLLDTGDQLIVETSLYGHFWGIGRDQRGENNMGKIWMDIRTRLRGS